MVESELQTVSVQNVDNLSISSTLDFSAMLP